MKEVCECSHRTIERLQDSACSNHEAGSSSAKVSKQHLVNSGIKLNWMMSLSTI